MLCWEGRRRSICVILCVTLAACSRPASQQTPPATASAPATSGSPSSASSAPAATAPSAPAPTPPSPSHGPDDTPIVISDGSLWIGLNPLAPRTGGGGPGKYLTFTNFMPQPEERTEVRAITLMDLYQDDTRLVWDGLDVNGTAPATCQNPEEDCLVQLQYEGPGMDVEVAWNASNPNVNHRVLTIRFPGRPVNQWIDWVRDSHVILHPVDWDHSARKRFQQIFFNRAPQPVNPDGNRLTIHLKPAPRR